MNRPLRQGEGATFMPVAGAATVLPGIAVRVLLAAASDRARLHYQHQEEDPEQQNEADEEPAVGRDRLEPPHEVQAWSRRRTS